MLISGSTKVFALFGDPVTHSLSPIMQNAAFRALQLDCCYVSFLVRQDSLAAAVIAVRELNLGGVNITIPHKERVLAYLDQVDERALQIGAVNTIVNQDGHLCGYNTDASGFLPSSQPFSLLFQNLQRVAARPVTGDLLYRCGRHRLLG